LKFSLLSTVLLFILLNGCEKSTTKEELPDTNKKEDLVVVNLNDSVILSQSFEIQLEANHSTGYSWFWINNSSKFDSVSREYITLTDRIGGPGLETWIFKAINKGLDSLIFEYKRWWETNIPPLESKSYKILVE
jgi:predicted secreted protein